MGDNGLWMMAGLALGISVTVLAILIWGLMVAAKRADSIAERHYRESLSKGGAGTSSNVRKITREEEQGA